MQLYAAHRVSHIAFLCDACVCQFDTSNKIDIEQSIYYLREKKLKNFQENTWRALSMCYTNSVELTRMHWKTNSVERTKQLDEQKNGG